MFQPHKSLNFLLSDGQTHSLPHTISASIPASTTPLGQMKPCCESEKVYGTTQKKSSYPELQGMLCWKPGPGLHSMGCRLHTNLYSGGGGDLSLLKCSCFRYGLTFLAYNASASTTTQEHMEFLIFQKGSTRAIAWNQRTLPGEASNAMGSRIKGPTDLILCCIMWKQPT